MTETAVAPTGQRCEAFSLGESRLLSVEQLSQLFSSRLASGQNAKQLGQLFYNKCFTALPTEALGLLFSIPHGSRRGLIAAAPTGADDWMNFLKLMPMWWRFAYHRISAVMPLESDKKLIP